MSGFVPCCMAAVTMSTCPSLSKNPRTRRSGRPPPPPRPPPARSMRRFWGRAARRTRKCGSGCRLFRRARARYPARPSPFNRPPPRTRSGSPTSARIRGAAFARGSRVFEPVALDDDIEVLVAVDVGGHQPLAVGNRHLARGPLVRRALMKKKSASPCWRKEPWLRATTSTRPSPSKSATSMSCSLPSAMRCGVQAGFSYQTTRLPSMATTSGSPSRSTSATSPSVPNAPAAAIVCFFHAGFSYHTKPPATCPPAMRSGRLSPLRSPTAFSEISSGPCALSYGHKLPHRARLHSEMDRVPAGEAGRPVQQTCDRNRQESERVEGPADSDRIPAKTSVTGFASCTI